MKHLIKYTIILLASLTSIFGFAQEPAPPVIDLPENGGSMIWEVLHADGKIFAYASDGISIYDAANNDFETKIAFDNSNTYYGKFNPVYFNHKLAAVDQHIMMFNGGSGTETKYIYTLTPALKLLVINTTNNQAYFTSLKFNVGENEIPLEQLLESQNNRVILRYDNSNDKNRLFVLVAGRNPENGNCTGKFHVQKSLFGIYNINVTINPDENGHLGLIYSEINSGLPTVYSDKINNFIVNELNSKFYITRTGEQDPVSEAHIQIGEINSNNEVTLGQPIEFENIGGTGWFKVGKMLYINETNIHKILIFPYRYPSGVVPSPRFCVIDGTSDAVEFIDAPSSRIMDAAYLEDHNRLVLCYSPDEKNIEVDKYENSNLAIFQYNQVTFIEPSDDDGEIYTDTDSPLTSVFDLNASFDLTKLNGSTALVSNKDGIGILEYNTSSEKYEYSTILNAESNFFRKGAVVPPQTNPKVFIPNTLGNGFEIYENGNFTSLKTGYPVYHITANSDGNNMFFYNKLNAHAVGLYTYSTSSGEVVNINDDDEENNNIETAIGDVVYNPFQDHFLISKFEPGDAKILVLNASDNSFVQEIQITNYEFAYEFAKEMFISPNGRLYVSVNMNNSNDHNPSIFIYDAKNYNSIKVEETGGFIYTDPFAYYTAQFEYNTYNQSVYATIAIQDEEALPYNTEKSSIHFLTGATPPGKLLVLKDAKDYEYNLSQFPGKVLCPNTGDVNTQTQYHGKLFIMGKELYEYDYLNPPESGSVIPSYPEYFVDIVYSPYHDKLFAVKDLQGSENCPEHRKFQVWTIYYENEQLRIEELVENGLTFEGQMAGLFYNPYNKLVYVYQKVDAQKTGGSQVRLLSFDPQEGNPVWNITLLGIKSYFPSYDYSSDPAHFYFYNMTTPYISPFNNKIYLPNGGHSCVSTVEFVPNEALFLEAEEWSWFSFPRTTVHPFQESVSIVDGNILPETFSWAEISNLPFGSDISNGIVTMDFDGENWSYTTEGLTDIHNVRGYKLQFQEEDYAERYLYLHGTVIEPSTEIELYGDQKENWTGYWLYQTQDILDALGSQESKFYLIKHEDWTCVRGTAPWKSGGTGPPDPNAWTCDKSVRNLRYGDMVVLKSDFRDEDNKFSFTWAFNGYLPPDEDATQNPSYYTYSEQSDYTPIVVELDSADQPLEIGAFVNDTCVGASVVDNGDSTVAIRAYLDGNAEDSVTFEKFYGTKSTNSQRIRDYYIWDRDHQYKKKGVIRLKDGRDHYFVSFRKTKQEEDDPLPSTFTYWPNPASTEVICQFDLDADSRVTIQLLDITGQLVTQWLNESLTEGQHRFQFELNSFGGNKFKAGIYFIRFKAGETMETKKLIVK